MFARCCRVPTSWVSMKWFVSVCCISSRTATLTMLCYTTRSLKTTSCRNSASRCYSSSLIDSPRSPSVSTSCTFLPRDCARYSTMINCVPGTSSKYSTYVCVCMSIVLCQSITHFSPFPSHFFTSTTMVSPEPFPHRTRSAVRVRRNGNFQTPISVPAVIPKRCHTLSNPAHKQDYTVACLNYTLQTMMSLPG